MIVSHRTSRACRTLMSATGRKSLGGPAPKPPKKTAPKSPSPSPTGKAAPNPPKQSSKTPKKNPPIRWPSIKKEDKPEVSPSKWEKDALWRMHSLKVSSSQDPGKDDYSIHKPLIAAIAARLGCGDNATSSIIDFISRAEMELKGTHEASSSSSPITLVRKSFDARKGKRDDESTDKNWVYVVDLSSELLDHLGCNPKVPRFYPKENWFEKISHSSSSAETSSPSSSSPSSSALESASPAPILLPPSSSDMQYGLQPDPVVVVGSGPAGLFAALEIASRGIKVILLERGQGVEQRGRDIGALFVRRRLNPDSNLCYGEGGAGTWSDGKLTTRIGKNSDPVRRVLSTFVDCGADPSILVSGKPHLGTDKLVRMLKAFRVKLMGLGVQVRFGATVDDFILEGGSCRGNRSVLPFLLTVVFSPRTLTDFILEGGRCKGVVLMGASLGGGASHGGESIKASAVVLAVGHSARNLYRKLHRSGQVAMSAKPFALGFRIEHPQSLIDEIQYGSDAEAVLRGRGVLPVADYNLAVQVMDGKREMAVGADGQPLPGILELSGSLSSSSSSSSSSASSSSSLSSSDGEGGRGVYSFCMCPGGQIVPTSTDENSLCINGMSFSRRNSLWANSALVVSTDERDWSHLVDLHGPLAGVALQEEYEREGARMGGFGFRAPVQRVQDFLQGHISNTETLPSSSYRLGVTSAPLHRLFSPTLTGALGEAMCKFERRLPGFISRGEGLLHGVETRTSAPVKIERDREGCESVSMPGLFPCGEGAGFAGGIVSAAVDGLRVGSAVVAKLLA